MTVVTRRLLESSPLADLHAVAGELGIDGFRRLRKEELVDAISQKRGGSGSEGAEASDSQQRSGRNRGRNESRQSERGERNGSRSRGESNGGSGQQRSDRAERSGRVRGGQQGDSGRRTRGGSEQRADVSQDGAIASGVVSIGSTGSGLVKCRDGSEVYLSSGQIRRCELVDGDKVSGPTRPARGSERYPSFVRVEEINGSPADSVPGPAAETESNNQASERPNQLLQVDDSDPTASAIGWLVPIGRGSRASIVGPAGSGKTEALRRLGSAISSNDGIELSVALIGSRPEESAEWAEAGIKVATDVDLTATAEAAATALQNVISAAQRSAASGSDVVLLVDTLDRLPHGSARRLLGNARNLSDAGSLTIIATSTSAVGGESTLVTLDKSLTLQGKFPALDLANSWTARAELLVGEEGLAAITAARTSL